MTATKTGARPPKTSMPVEAVSKIQSLAARAAGAQSRINSEIERAGKTIVFKNIRLNPNTLMPNKRGRVVPNGAIGEYDLYSLCSIYIESKEAVLRATEETGIDYNWIVDELTNDSGKFMPGMHEIAFSSRERSLFRVNHQKDAMGNFVHEPEFFTMIETALMLNERHDKQKINLLRIHVKNQDNPFLSPEQKSECTYREIRPEVVARENTELEKVKADFYQRLFTTPYEELIAVATCIGVSPQVLADASPDNDILRNAVLQNVGTEYKMFLNLFEDEDIEFYTNYQFAKMLGVIHEMNGDLYWRGQSAPFKRLGSDSDMNLMKKFAEFAKSQEGISVYKEMLSRLEPFQG